MAHSVSLPCSATAPCGACVEVNQSGSAIIAKYAGSCSPDDRTVDYSIVLYCDGTLDAVGVSDAEARRIIDAKMCDDCGGTTTDPHDDDSGTYCQPCRAKAERQAALDAGIPASVIDGRTKLTDHFSREYIAGQCDPKGGGS